MRTLLFALLSLAAILRAADDDLFTGVTPEKVPADVSSFLRSLTNAINTGEANSVLNYAVTRESTGTGMFLLRQRLTALNKERKVKKIEMLPSVAEADVEDLRNGVTYRPAAKPSHTVVVRLEGAPGDVALIELPVAKVLNPDANANAVNKEGWRIMTSTAVLPPGESARLAEAKSVAEKRPDVVQFQIELGLLHALLGQRKEAEAIETNLRELADGKAIRQASLIHTQVGWIRYHLGDTKPALEAFKKGFELAKGGSSNAEVSLAVGYYATGEFALAVRHYDHAAGQTPLFSDRETVEKYLKDSRAPDTAAVLSVMTRWQRAFVPNPVPQP